jgi:hypothetical protein
VKFMRILFLVAIISTLALTAVSQNSSAKSGAEKTGLQWLGMIDNGAFAGSYDSAAAMFKAAVTEQKWIHSLDAVRTPLGSLVSRKLRSATYATELPGAPDGEYVVMQFNSSFNLKKQAVETLTMALDKDGQWRASGYFIK